MRLVVVVAVLMTIQKMMELHPRMIRRWSLLHLPVVSGWAGTVSPRGTTSHLKAALLDVVKLEAERLYAAYDPPLVTKQTDPDAPDVTEGRDQHGKKSKTNDSNAHNRDSTVSYLRFPTGSCFSRLLMHDSLYAHGSDGIQGCVSCCEEVVFVLAHLDGVQPVTDGDEERVVGQVIRRLGETAGKYAIQTRKDNILYV